MLDGNFVASINFPLLKYQFPSLEIGENNFNRVEAVEEVRSWLETQPHLKNCRRDGNFILRFLRTNKYKIDKTCQMIERYLKMRMAHPKWFQNLDIEVTIYLFYSENVF